MIGRLKPGVTLDQARADLSFTASRLARQYPDNDKWYTSALVEPELNHLTGDVRPALRLLLGAVVLMLLIACANVAGLLMARSSTRSSEMALRASLGATRGAILCQLLVESVLLALSGGVAGLALSFVLLHSLLRLMPVSIPRLESITINTPVFVFVAAASISTGLLFGLLPAWRMSAGKPALALREGLRTVTGGRERHRVHNALVVMETALCLVLLVGSGLFIRSFIELQKANPGFDSQHVWTTRIGLSLSFDQFSHDRHFQIYDRLCKRLTSMPGIQAASAGWPLPISGDQATVSFNIQGRPVSKGDEPSESFGVVTPGYFETLRIPLRAGRLFTPQDGPAAKPVIVVNEAFARKYFRDESPLGRQIQVRVGNGVVNRPIREVIGVVGDIKSQSLMAEPAPQYYLPYPQAVVTNPPLVIRTSADGIQIESAVRSALREFDPGAPIYRTATLESYLSTSAAQPRFQAVLLTCFAAIALLLASIGLYGLLSYTVAQRSQEIGVRIALGAQKAEVLRMILRRGVVLALLGVGVGLLFSAMTVRLLSGMLYNIQPHDAVSFVAMAGVLFIVSLLASSIPAYRASQLDPITTLREQ